MRDPIIYAVKGHVATITLNRPDRHNALNIEMRRQWAHAVERLNGDPDVRAGVLLAAGDKAFCVGVDLHEMSQRDSQGKARAGGREAGLPVLPAKPLIAAINGYCLAGGLELALMCDIRVASASASFGLPEVKRCLIPRHAVNLLPAIVPSGFASYLLLSGERVTADKALAMGLVQEVLPSKAEAEAAALRIAQAIAANAPLAVQAIKRLLAQYGGSPSEDGYERTDDARHRLRGTEDALEGPRAFTEKRDPVWQGK